MRSMRLVIVIVAVSLLTACGFKLRNSNPVSGRALPFATISLSLPVQSEFYAQVQTAIEASASTRVVTDAGKADAILTVLSDTSEKSILSLSAAGRAREFQLVRNFKFRVHTSQQADYVPVSQISVRRTMTFSDDLVLSKESEEAVIWADIQKDLISQLMRRILAAKAKPVAPAED
ncbi:rare lipoprotein B [Sulfuritalea hydrogenivorans sk43H]|uniref:LPS-assembly lipoprotein LptE n=2 Tax=Sulfuritalea hydrogenivorans TaxID=748811 RepID=W0SHW0_9PROT|nr:rare lipoprotein B [Sulfuritalea hydrogenivorans sk43H]